MGRQHDGQCTQVGGAQPLTFSSTGAVTAPVGGALAFNGFIPPGGALPMNLSFNFGTSTQYGSQFGVTSITQNGFTTGQLSTVAIDTSGVVSAVYTNAAPRSWDSSPWRIFRILKA